MAVATRPAMSCWALETASNEVLLEVAEVAQLQHQAHLRHSTRDSTDASSTFVTPPLVGMAK